MSHPTSQQIEETIANGRRLVEQAQEALARTDQFFAEHGIDPAEALDALYREGGNEAVQALQAEVRETLQRIEAEVQRDKLHATKARNPAQRVRVPRPMV